MFIHNPHRHSESGGRVAVVDTDISFLNVNQTVTALCTGRLDPSLKRDILCIGSQTNLLAYDVHDNKDLFYKEVRLFYVKNKSCCYIFIKRKTVNCDFLKCFHKFCLIVFNLYCILIKLLGLFKKLPSVIW